MLFCGEVTLFFPSMFLFALFYGFTLKLVIELCNFVEFL